MVGRHRLNVSVAGASKTRSALWCHHRGALLECIYDLADGIKLRGVTVKKVATFCALVYMSVNVRRQEGLSMVGVLET